VAGGPPVLDGGFLAVNGGGGGGFHAVNAGGGGGAGDESSESASDAI
jgi:hypothetical protein